MAVLCRDQVRQQQTREAGLAEAIAQEEIVGRILIQRALQLPADLGETRGEDGILAVVFSGERDIRRPVRETEIRIEVGEVEALVEARGEAGDGDRLGFATEILARVFECRAWSPKSLFTGLEFRGQSDRR